MSKFLIFVDIYILQVDSFVVEDDQKWKLTHSIMPSRIYRMPSEF